MILQKDTGVNLIRIKEPNQQEYTPQKVGKTKSSSPWPDKLWICQFKTVYRISAYDKRSASNEISGKKHVTITSLKTGMWLNLSHHADGNTPPPSHAKYRTRWGDLRFKIFIFLCFNYELNIYTLTKYWKTDYLKLN